MVRIADQQPSNRHGRQAGVIPDSGLGIDPTVRRLRSYQRGRVRGCHGVSGSSRWCWRAGKRAPLQRGRPTWWADRGGAGAYRAASSRRRVTTVTYDATASRKANAAKLLSATTTIRPSRQPTGDDVKHALGAL